MFFLKSSQVIITSSFWTTLLRSLDVTSRASQRNMWKYHRISFAYPLCLEVINRLNCTDQFSPGIFSPTATLEWLEIGLSKNRG